MREWLKRWAKNLFTTEITPARPVTPGRAETKEKIKENLRVLRGFSGNSFEKPTKLATPQDTCYVGTIKGIGRIYQQTFIDTNAKIGFAKLYTSKHAITAADLLNDRVLPWYDIAFRKKIYTTPDDLQADLDQWMAYYNAERPHSGKYCDGRTPDQTFSETKHLADEKMIDTLFPKEVARQDSNSFAVTA